MYITDYVITFAYDAAGSTVRGKYTTRTPPELGHKFDILYDPKHPKRNTGSDGPVNPWVKWAVRIVGIGIAILVHWLWGDQDWLVK